MVFRRSRVVWDCSSNIGDRSLLRLNIIGRPIVQKYSDGKLKITLKIELKEPEIAQGETDVSIVYRGS